MSCDCDRSSSFYHSPTGEEQETITEFTINTTSIAPDWKALQSALPVKIVTIPNDEQPVGCALAHYQVSFSTN